MSEGPRDFPGNHWKVQLLKIRGREFFRSRERGDPSSVLR
ncbi:hypothetical protein COLO4_28204 [Corchorus olitorius]|uniref:Uncharacterized protein n=1 Tax=Corchorus olitorius TaxID=93759 RepID=A0A1R3HML1_9ROSI|nr:hypothetical protein COLO4_28204 [Corchorus olitorius]